MYAVTRKPKGHYKPRTPLEKRALALTRRGFDVPPSKEAEYRRLMRNKLPLLQVKELLGLE